MVDMSVKKATETDVLTAQLGFDLVDVYVGPEKQRFRVHKDLLCARIPYFDKMFNGAFKEAQEQVAFFPDDSATVFGLLVHWVYTSRLPALDIEASEAAKGPLWDRICLYGLAEKFCVPDLPDYLMTNILSNFAGSNRCPSLEGMKLAYEVTGEGSPLRSFMAKFLLYATVKGSTSDSYYSSKIGALVGSCEDIATDLVVLLGTWATNIASDKLPKRLDTWTACEFHLHEEGQACAYKDKVL